jgi:hypothetical protein
MRDSIKARRFFLLVVLVLPLCALSQTRLVQYLSGTGSDQTVAWDFFCTGGRQSGYWTSIPVPSCWEQQGFGTYNYGRDYKTYGKNFRFADEKGLYRHRFRVPAAWRGKQVQIVFEGSMTDTEVKINGTVAGPVHQGAFYRFRYDITDKLKFGADNLLEVTVSKMSADVSVNNAERLADYWVFGGIFRPVYLEALNETHMDHTAIDAKADGSFAIRVQLQHIRSSGQVSIDIRDREGRLAASAKQSVNKGDSVVVLRTRVTGALSWTSETPHLYEVTTTLREQQQAVDARTEKFGFRTIEVRRGDGIYVNGVQVKMKGTNRHCFWPETGRTLSRAVQLQDALLLKEMNMNAVRCSHYPPDAYFLDLCDSLGLYVLDELAGWQKAYSTPAGKPLVREMVLKDVNHPSILFWDNGNEGGTNKELDAEFGKWDFSGRPVIHPHHRPGNDFNGIDCNHYEDYYSTKKILEDSLIYMPTEFLHAQDDGGAGAGMYDFWELHWNARRSGGGFIWAMVDEGVVRTDMHGVVDANGLNANDGILGPHREKEGSFFALREIFSPVRIASNALAADFNGSLELENRYHFTNLNQCTFRWQLVNFPHPFRLQAAGHTVVQEGRALCPSIAPLQKGRLPLALPATYRNADALVLTATDPQGREIYQWTFRIRPNGTILREVLSAKAGTAAVTRKDSVITLQGGDITVTIDPATGLLNKVLNKSAGNLSFNNGPVLLQGAGMVTGAKTYQQDQNSIAEFTYSGALRSARWTMYGNGWLSLEYTYVLSGSYPFTGVSFSYPENYILGAKWLGKGPYRQWKNRIHGTSVNVWQNLYNNTQTGYAPLVYPEFKGYYGDVTWMEFNTVEGRFYVASKDTGLYVRLFDFYGLTGPKGHPDLPAGNISFLDCIPAIGTKLALNISSNTQALGPQSEPTRIDRPVTRTLYFYFGLPKNTDAAEQYSRPAVDNVF